MNVNQISLDTLIHRFKDMYEINNSEHNYLSQLIVSDINHPNISDDSKLKMLIEEVDFFIVEFIRSANMFRFTNDLLNKDRARVINDQLFLLHQLFVFLLDEVHYSKALFCDENTLTMMYEAIQKMERSLEKYAPFVFQ